MDLERIKQNFRIRSGRSQKIKKKKPQPTELSEKSTPPRYGPTANGTVKESRVESKIESPVTESQTAESESTQNFEANGSTQVHESDPGPDIGSEHADVEQPLDDVEAEERPDLLRATTEVPAKNATMDEDDMATEQDDRPKPSRRETEPNHHTTTASSDADDFDLQPPKPKAKPPSLETTAELLWSSGHLDALLHHPPQLAGFSAFLQRYLPDSYPYLAQYLETQKAIKAVEYANAIAEGLAPKDTQEDDLSLSKQRAAQLDAEFEKISNASFKALVHDALPTFINYLLIKVVSECLTNEITGRSTPVMRDLVGGLSEVFCLTDPKREDNPIIYASEEFYRLTRYGPEDVINNNCRFLQGKKTNPESPKRLKAAVQGGEEITETLLNYRRDGRPFINMLMIAPLHDKRGRLKYHIGAQIDVSGLVEGGRALQGFQRYLNRRADDARRTEVESRRKPLNDEQLRKKKVLARLRDLSESFDLEESAIVQAHSRSNSLERDEDDNRSVGSIDRAPRRYYADSDGSDIEDEQDASDGEKASKWKLGDGGDGRLSGKLPGVYDSFMLLKPAPSLRIVFVSPKLRQFKDVLQTTFMSHVSAPAATITGLNESLKEGVPVSAKIHFSIERGDNRDGNVLRSGHKHEDGKNGFAIWVSCTPMLDADDRIGVWMCVVVEKSKVGAARRKQTTEMQESRSRGRTTSTERPDTQIKDEELMSHPKLEDNEKPIKPVRIGSKTKIDTTKKKASGEDTKPVQGQRLKEKESVYFDTEQNRGSEADESSSSSDPYRLNGLPEEESVTPDANLKQIEIHSLTHGPQAVTPERSYGQPSRPTKPFSASIPGLERLPHYDFSDDEVVSIQSPQTQQTPPRHNERVLIEEDSDFVSADESSPTIDDDMKHHRDNLNVGSADPIPHESTEQQPESAEYRADHVVPPSVSASANLPDDDKDFQNQEVGSKIEESEQESFEREDEGIEKYEKEPSNQKPPEDQEQQASPEENDEFAKSEETLRAIPDDITSLHPAELSSHSPTKRRDISFSPPYNRAQSEVGGVEPEMALDKSGAYRSSEKENLNQDRDENVSSLSDKAETTTDNGANQSTNELSENPQIPGKSSDKSKEAENPLTLVQQGEVTDSKDLIEGESEHETELDQQDDGITKEAGGESQSEEVENSEENPEEVADFEVTHANSKHGLHLMEKEQHAAKTTNQEGQESTVPSHKHEVSKTLHTEEQKQTSTQHLKTDASADTPGVGEPNPDIKELEDKLHSLDSDLQDLVTSPPASTVKYLGHDHTEQDREYGREEDFGLKTPTSYQSDLGESAELPVARDSSDGEEEATRSDRDKDSARSMDSPAQNRRTPVAESPPLSPARHAAEVEPDLKHDQPIPKHVDVESWVQDSRPASSHEPNKTRVRMDYLMAGSSRWSKAGRPQLSLEMLEQANKGAHFGLGDDDDDTNDPCIRSPYSVD